MRLFKKDDNVIYIKDEIYYELTLHKSYKVLDAFNIKAGTKHDLEDQLILLNDDYCREVWAKSKYFKLDICRERKNKLEKICLNQEIK